MVVFTLKKHRIAHENATVCYLKKDDKVLMLKFSKKCDHVYAPQEESLKVEKVL